MSKERFLVHRVEGGTSADKRGARGGWLVCLLDLVFCVSQAEGQFVSVLTSGRIFLGLILLPSHRAPEHHSLTLEGL